VLRESPESGGRGGSALMHRAFREGRRVFVTRPVNHFALHEDATHSWLFAGGIGVTPMIAMAHRLHALGKPFDFHYSAASRSTAGFLKDLAQVPWRDRVQFHFKDEGQRADLMQLVPDFAPGQHVYTCGAARFMDGVFDAATAHGWPDEADAWVNQPFELLLQKTGRRLQVPAERSATEVLAEAGVAIDVKCSDGLCGVCAVPYDAQASDEIEHRDFVLGAQARQQKIILCCSRARHAQGLITLVI
jgi:ferredoxin-NADP reductase